MNKLTKVGCSALCGSLAAISAANAGDITVTGGADMTYVSLGGQTTGNPIGIGSNLTFKGSGELDNGWTVGLTIANANLNAYSSTVVNLGMGGLGSLNFNSGDSGNGLMAIDDKLPTAWEESWGAGLSTGVRLPSGSGASMNVMYTTPTVLGTTMTFTVAPDYGTSDTADKATAATSDENDASYDATININPSLGTEILSGLNIFGGASTIEREDSKASKDDAYYGTAGFTYDLGPVSVGAQWAAEYTGVDDGEDMGDASGDWNLYKNYGFGVAFNVNDDFSISYGEYESRKSGYADTSTSQPDENGKTVRVSSVQAAYTMGGASIRIADVNADNVLWSSGTNHTATIVSLALAF